ncbi:MAG: zinc ABC transporter ATP-binding protein ZnuC [Alphaproteobacteria bacterium]
MNIASPSPHRLDGVLVDARGLTKRYGGHAVLDAVDLTLRRGELTTLIGPNGSGKTTLVRLLLGLERPNEGSVTAVEGLRVGYVPQVLHVDESLPITVRRFLALGGSQKAEIETALAEVGASHVIGAPLQTISGGEMRRVLLARALLREPDLLVLDEPTAGVDLNGQAELYELINTVRRNKNCAVLLISHDLHVVMAATDHVVCLNHHVCCSGAPDAVSEHPEYLALFGPKAARTHAVYTHDHDHAHTVGGDVVPLTKTAP